MEKKWEEVDQYIEEKLLKYDSILNNVLENNSNAGLPPIDVAPNQAMFLHILAKMKGAKRILEIGTLGGYSTIWLARALPVGGKLITLEFEQRHAEVATSNIEKAGLLDLVEIRIGAALDTLAKLEVEGVEPFDFIFIDADKENNAKYLEWSLKLAKVGTVIIGDNVVRAGEVTNSANTDSRIEGVRHFFDALSKEDRILTTAIQTVGSKGYDGFSISIVQDKNKG
ncbi:O-methyltransferase [Sutcliffiella halmapala]|uniref:O-methyltransferase n=1 Tax=Sutcliffiella halmapala TaxID=79882 RepID=UPI000995D4B2|nr:O-methyltransferase [Sutcliffiella halmapala]